MRTGSRLARVFAVVAAVIGVTVTTSGSRMVHLPVNAKLIATGDSSCSAQAFGAALGPDGNVWFLDSGDSAIGRVTPTGSITQFPFASPHGQFAGGVTSGPDGAVWFAEGTRSQVGRIDPTSGAITEFPVSGPGFNTGISSITSGPDGNLWFGWQNSARTNQVGRMTPTGAVTFFPISFVPNGIVTGSDGRIWASGNSVDGGPNGTSEGVKVAALTTAGVVSEFLDPTPQASSTTPSSAVLGADGNVWYLVEARRGTTNTGDALVGRITPAGAITDFPIANDGGDPAGGSAIGAGPDGRIWVALSWLQTPVKLAAVATGAGAGTTTLYHPAGLAVVGGLVGGSDGNVWFVGGDVVGHIGTDGANLTSIPVPAAYAVTCLLNVFDGPAQGGTALTITGRGFTNVTRVRFGTVAKTSFTVVSPTELKVTTPAHAPAYVSVFVDTTAGPGTSHVIFQYYGAPTVSDVCDGAGPRSGGDQVVISGSNMAHATKVLFGTRAVAAIPDYDDFGEVSDYSVEAIVPPSPTNTTVDVRVVNPAGKSAVSTNSHYRYLPRNSVPVPVCYSALPKS